MPMIPSIRIPIRGILLSPLASIPPMLPNRDRKVVTILEAGPSSLSANFSALAIKDPAFALGNILAGKSWESIVLPIPWAAPF